MVAYLRKGPTVEKLEKMKKILLIIVVGIMALPLTSNAQQVLTLEDCKRMAIDNNNSLKTARQKVEIAGYDKKIAAANYFPKITALGTYQYTTKDIQLIGDDATAELTNAGSILQNGLSSKMTAILSDPTIYQEVMKSPALQKIVGQLKQTDIATPINAIGAQISSALTLDISNVLVGVVSVEQPVFMGGKIVASNKMAELAEQLSQARYDQEYSQTAVDIEQAYWQIVSIAGKKKLSEGYADLLHRMEKDTDALIKEGFATPSDALTIKVKTNEAEMLLTKATNGLALSKMLLCKDCGLQLDSDIVLADESLDRIPVPQMSAAISDEDIYDARPEIRSLKLANDIYAKKVDIARADMLPTIALTANYYVTNPNVYDGFRNKFGDNFSAGVVVSVPIFHGTEALQKTRKAKAEAVLTQIQLSDAEKMISLQVAQQRKQFQEAVEKYTMAESNLDNAEENLRVATAGWNEGAIASSVVLQAQTAWLQAHSEYIETGVELQMCSVNLAKAEGRLK